MTFTGGKGLLRGLLVALLDALGRHLADTDQAMASPAHSTQPTLRLRHCDCVFLAARRRFPVTPAIKPRAGRVQIGCVGGELQAVMTSVVNNVTQGTAHLPGSLQHMVVIAVGKHHTRAPLKSIETPRRANAKTSDPSTEHVRAVCLHDEMNVIALDGPIRNAKTRALRSQH